MEMLARSRLTTTYRARPTLLSEHPFVVVLGQPECATEMLGPEVASLAILRLVRLDVLGVRTLPPLDSRDLGFAVCAVPGEACLARALLALRPAAVATSLVPIEVVKLLGLAAVDTPLHGPQSTKGV
jgi:hypothetical protein